MSDIKTKTGNLRIVVYERLQDKFYYFNVPNHVITGLTAVRIPFDLDGTPRRYYKRNITQKTKWWAYECESFDHLCA